MLLGEKKTSELSGHFLNFGKTFLPVQPILICLKVRKDTEHLPQENLFRAQNP